MLSYEQISYVLPLHLLSVTVRQKRQARILLVTHSNNISKLSSYKHTKKIRKGDVVPMKAYGENESTVPLILNLGDRWR